MSPLDWLRNLKSLFNRAARETAEVKGVAESTRDDYDAIGNFEAWIADKERRRAPRLSVDSYPHARKMVVIAARKWADAFRIGDAAECERVSERFFDWFARLRKLLRASDCRVYLDLEGDLNIVSMKFEGRR